jgi:hypothetical protein
VLTLGGQAIFLKLVKADVSEANSDTLFQVFLQTAPLTLGVMLVGIAMLREWFDDGMLVFIVATMFASLHLGSWLGGLGTLPSMGEGWLTLLFGGIAFYWKVYGPSLFVSSIVLGAFLAWVVNKLWPGPAAAKLFKANAK